MVSEVRYKLFDGRGHIRKHSLTFFDLLLGLLELRCDGFGIGSLRCRVSGELVTVRLGKLIDADLLYAAAFFATFARHFDDHIIFISFVRGCADKHLTASLAFEGFDLPLRGCEWIFMLITLATERVLASLVPGSGDL